MMKPLYLFFYGGIKSVWALSLIFFLSTVSFGQNVTLSGGLSGSFPTLNAAFNTINTGGESGNVVATIVGNTTETIQAVLNQTAYTVQIVPQGNRIIECNFTTPLLL